MSAATLLAAGQQFHASSFAASVTIKGDTYAGGTGGLSTENRLAHDGGGFVSVQKVAFWFARSLFSTVPKSNSHVTWNGATYLLETVSEDPTGQTVTLHCVSMQQ